MDDVESLFRGCFMRWSFKVCGALIGTIGKNHLSQTEALLN